MEDNNNLDKRTYYPLWNGKYLQTVTMDNDPSEYEILNEGYNIIVLPYLRNIDKFIIRKEYCPPYIIKDNINDNNLWYTVISGGIEKNEKPLDTVIRELREEAGIEVENARSYIMQKNIPLCKSTSLRSYIYFLDIEKYSTCKPIGDGTVGESKSYSVKVSLDELDDIIHNSNYKKDFLLCGLYYAYIVNKELKENIIV